MFPAWRHATRSVVQRDTGARDLDLTTVTASGTAHTKGSWVELVGSAYDFNVGLVVVHYMNVAQGGTNTAALLDIGIGASSSEVVLLPDILVGAAQNATSAHPTYAFRVAIPAGTRIAGRSQSAISSDTVDVSIDLFEAGNYPAFGRATNYGADDAVSHGVQQNQGPGNWIEIESSAAHPIRSLVVMQDGTDDTSLGGGGNIVDVGVGASGSEVVVARGPFYSSGSDESVGSNWLSAPDLNLNIPAGSRLATRFWGSNDTGVSIMGLD